MTLTFTDPSVLENLDFAPACSSTKCRRVATHVLVLWCGCVSALCRPCVDVQVGYVQQESDIVRLAEFRSPYWRCFSCTGTLPGRVWPIKQVRSL